MQLEEIKGIGPRTVNTLKRLGIFDTYDLATYYPFRYNIIERSDLSSLQDGDKITIDGQIESTVSLLFLKGHKDKMSFQINTGEKILQVMIFNRGFMKNKLTIGQEITVIGKYDRKRNQVIASDIRLSKLGDIPIIEPIYHITTGINNSQIHRLILGCSMDDIVDYVPNYLNEQYGFLRKEKSLRTIHQPIQLADLKLATQKLKYEELFIFMLKMNSLKIKKTNKGLPRKVDFSLISQWIETLPFVLTEDQQKCVLEIYRDLVSEKRMNRLLQGDVGSGKTIVSFAALYINYLSGYQGALMAPTEILARQHYENMLTLFPNLQIALLTGKLKVKEKREIYQKLKSHEIDIVIGTHALISEEVQYASLGLVITDEQHRFGVNQRSTLKNKGISPDILYMSATPIPRTYAITLFGDMDISNIKTKPSGRKEIITLLRRNSEMKDVLTRMLEQLKHHHQVYIIAPLIEESEKISLENVHELQSKMERAFGKYYKIGVMHGKLSNKEKEEVMTSFQQNEIQILISTTVIEVGVDVRNATMMVVFDSYRFGLSALHQLRGRVGRNDLQSYFIMISDQEAERLTILTQTSDGFKISEEDFRLRGSGDLFGVKQSGDMQFKLAKLPHDFKMLTKAKEDSEWFLKKYKDDPKYKYILDLLKTVDNLD